MPVKIQTSLRLDDDKFEEAKQILSELGINFSEAVNIFTSLIVAKQGLPFDVVLPNDETKAAMLDTRARKICKPPRLSNSKVKSVNNEIDLPAQNVH